MAVLLEQSKTSSARIRVENIIRSDLLTELHEQLELYCELLLARSGLLEPAQLDPGLDEAVRSILYAAPRTDVRELHTARALLVEKYGKEFALAAQEDADGRVPEGVKRRLRAEPPSPELVEKYLEAIAAAYGIPYGESAAATSTPDDPSSPSGGTAQTDPTLHLAPSDPTDSQTADSPRPPRDLGPRSPVSVAPPSPSTDNTNPRLRLPGPPELRPNDRMRGVVGNAAAVGKPAPKTGGPGGEVPDVNDLEQRFKLLKR